MSAHLTVTEVAEIYHTPLLKLIEQAHTVHQKNFPDNAVQCAQLLSIKTGGCPEDCAYCPQSIHHKTGVNVHALLPADTIVAAARAAMANGATRFCLGAAWRSPTHAQVEALVPIIEQVKALGLETCLTAGMLTTEKAERLKTAGLNYYNHNLDTSENFYPEIITTRTYSDRLDTLKIVREAGIKVCCGGILGMGESDQDRIEFIHTLATLNPYPESVPINNLIAVENSALADTPLLDPLIFIRTLATARICMPLAKLRLSAGRTQMSRVTQTLCFYVGANSIHLGETLLTQPQTQDAETDFSFLKTLGLRPETHHV